MEMICGPIIDENNKELTKQIQQRAVVYDGTSTNNTNNNQRSKSGQLRRGENETFSYYKKKYLGKTQDRST